MNVTGIIAEYNPFHNGHAYHLKEARMQTNADFILVVMGGNFMQRGEPAIVDKYTRTEMALRAGADLVIELPSAFATGSAEFFAEGAVELLDATGVVTSLCFGSELGSLPLLEKSAQIFHEEPEDFQNHLKEYLRSGNSYPAAREQALIKTLGTSLNSDFMSSPNNILGIEYIKALLKRKSNIIPATVQRLGDYHGTIMEDDCSVFASASAIRTLLRNPSAENRSLLERQLPTYVLPLLYEQVSFRELEDFSAPLHYRLLHASDPLDFSGFLDVSEDLSRRIFSLRDQFQGYHAFIDLLKTRQYTRTRIARALLHILLEIRTDEVTLPKELRVLGFRKNAAPLLSEIKKQSRLPLITKLPKDGSMDAEIRRSALYHLGHPYVERQQKIVIL